MESNGQNAVQTTRTAFKILRRIRDNNGMRITDLARDLGLAKSTVHRHLSTLHDEGYVIKEANTYSLSLRFLDFGESARGRDPAYPMAGEKVKELAIETEERAQFLVEEQGLAVYVYREAGERAVQTDPGIGKCIPLHATAAGKAILAHSDREKVKEILTTQGLPALTDETITRKEELQNELEEIRSRGYGFNIQENVTGLHAVSVPVMSPDGKVIGALSVSGPSHRLTGEKLTDTFPRLLLGTANELELNIAHS